MTPPTSPQALARALLLAAEKATQPTTSPLELLPCPFCGYQLPADEGMCVVDVDEFGDKLPPAEWSYTGICCTNCAAFVPGDNKGREAAIAAWNGRADALANPSNLTALVTWALEMEERNAELEKALTDARTWHEAEDKALSKQPPSHGPNGNQWTRLQHREQIDLLTAAIVGKQS